MVQDFDPNSLDFREPASERSLADSRSTARQRAWSLPILQEKSFNLMFLAMKLTTHHDIYQ